MTVQLSELLPIILYILLIILVIVGIVFLFRLMKTLDKVDRVIEDLNEKSRKLNGLFSIVDQVTDSVVSFTDGFANFIGNGFSHLFSRKKRKGEMKDE